MKKTILMLAAVAIAFGASAQSNQPTEQMMREWRQTVQKRDISQRHLESDVPLSTVPAPKKAVQKSLPEDRVWFPGEWEEVRAIVVTPYYNYAPLESQGGGSWMADPLVTGWADYYKYSYNVGWQRQGRGPYKAIMDTTSSFGNVSFYLMDAIQLGGAEAWVRVEKWADTNIVLRKLQRMNLRRDNVEFICGPGNSFWYRDCGPICFYYGDQDSVAMLDFTYYPGRALDDSLPTIIKQQKGIPNYITKVEWEGGNCLVDGAGMVLSSDAIYSNNNDGYGQFTWDGENISSLTYSQDLHLNHAQVKQALHDMLGQRATYILPAYRYDGGTGHVDLYADAWDENGFVFSIMPDNYSNWVDYQTGAKNIDSLCSYKSISGREYYMMGHIPFPKDNNGNNFTSQGQYNNYYTRTYSNHTFVNNVIMQPCFSAVVNGQPSAAWDRDNIEALKSAYPGYTIYPVDVRDFDGSGGAIHCITKQIPAENPIRILHKNLHDTINIANMENIPVSAIITNKSGISQAKVMYRVVGTENWNTLNLTANGNRFSGVLPLVTGEGAEHSYEYYISATSNNGKTITKPMTAGQGGYYTFAYTTDATAQIDSIELDFETAPMPMENITFTFGESWVEEDNAPTIGIENVDNEELFGQFYPNPATAEAHISIDLRDGQSYSVSIIDLSGRTVHTSTLQTAGQVIYTINASRLAAGQYTVVFQSRDSRIVRKLIVQ